MSIMSITFFETFSGLGSSRGNKAIRTPNIPIVMPRIIHPSHHAPNHRGSFCVITGCSFGSMYKLKQA